MRLRLPSGRLRFLRQSAALRKSFSTVLLKCNRYRPATRYPSPQCYRERPLGSRMKLLMDFLQSRCVDVRVDLGGGDTGVAQHFLDLSQIGAARQ